MPVLDRRHSKKQTELRGLTQKGKMDITFFAIVIILLTIGLVMLFSASHYNAMVQYKNSYHFITRQFVFAVIGVVIMLAVSKINYQLLRKLKIPWIVFGVTIAMLGVVMVIPPMDGKVHRWIYFGSFSFQPSEIAKFAIVLLFAHLISLNYRKMPTFKFGFAFLVFLLAAICGLVVIETHFSATIIIVCIGIAMMLVGGTKLRYIMGTGGLGVAGIGILLILKADYAKKRLMYWLDPFSDPAGNGYQTIQSMYAIASGGFLGRGIGNSRQKYLWVPEPQNDFIFSIVCEELGFVGGAVIIILYAMLVWRGFTIAMHAPDKFGSLLAIGLTFQIGLQAALNILVVTNTIPNTGISLPFFSYGGTSLVMLLAQMGLVLSVSRASTVQKS